MPKRFRFSKANRLLGFVLLLLFSSFSIAFSQFILLYQKDGAADYDKLGFPVAGAGDVNGDGRADFIIGAFNTAPRIGGIFGDGAGSAYVYSGADGSLLYQKNGAAAGDELGWSVAGAGDVNGDGRADFIIGAPLASPGGLFQAGSAYVYFGADGSLFLQKDGAAVGDALGYSVAGAGDVDAGGVPDFIIGAPLASPGGLFQAGSVFVYSGAFGGLLYQINGSASYDALGGYSVAGAGDVNGDGRADFIIGAFNTAPRDILGFGAGSAYVYSGFSGLIYQKNGAAGDQLGLFVAGAGDVDGDGRPDFITGAYRADPGGLDAAGSAYVYSGATGGLLFQKDGAAAGDALGYSVAGAGDVNGDGKADFIVGAIYASPGGLDAAGSAFVYSGATGALLAQINGAEPGDYLGISVAGAGDVNGDGRADFIIGAFADPGGLIDAGSAYVYGLPCAAAKGDMNADTVLTAADVVLLLNCTFLGVGNCAICFADMNCDGVLTAADVVIELNLVFLGTPPPC